jgi:hypothetical protein
MTFPTFLLAVINVHIINSSTKSYKNGSSYKWNQAEPNRIMDMIVCADDQIFYTESIDELELQIMAHHLNIKV